MIDRCEFHVDPVGFRSEFVGYGVCLPITGYCYHPVLRVNKLEMLIGDQAQQVLHKHEIRKEFANGAHANNAEKLIHGFYTLAPVIDGVAPLSLRLRACLSDQSQHEYLIDGSNRDNEIEEKISLTHSYQDDQPLVAIAMATYEPDMTRFKRQMDSILGQDYENWFCIVRDDASSPTLQEEIETVCRQDERIYFSAGAENVGFYMNFEKCLFQIPEEADFIALADQDDKWNKDKITRLVNEIENDASLVYSDMRIVDSKGQAIANTYWSLRKNEHKDLSVLLLANTVTGAASLFRRELLDDILPFPERIGDAFHDHWIACVALAKGKITYIDTPLYDYFQYDDSVIGHCDHQQSQWKDKFRQIKSSVLKKRTPTAIKDAIAKLRNASLAVYEFECRRLELICKTILLRRAYQSDCVDDLMLFGYGLRSGFRLLVKHVLIRWRGQTTDDAEFRLALGYVFKSLDDFRFALRKRFLRRVSATVQPR